MSAFVLNVIGRGAEPGLFGGLGAGPAVILSPGHAFDLPVAGRAALVAAQDIAGDAPLDINLVATAHRRKKLLIADMDSTIINVECLDELADMAGLKPQIAAITERAMRGELEFESALRERVGMLKGLPLSALERTYAERVRLNPGAKSLLATMRAHGAHTMLVSGGFGFFTRRVAQAAGFHSEQGNILLDDGAHLTGKVGEPILGREAKLATLEKAAAGLGLDLVQTLAVGDGANDLAMIGKAGLGVAYHAKPVVAEAAGAAISHNDLTALLYLQGYKDEEIVRNESRAMSGQTEGPRYLCLVPGGALPPLNGAAPFRAVVVIDCEVTPEWQAQVSDWLVRGGCRYMMAWGLRCSNWDTSVDEANLAIFGFEELPDENFVMTTWHEKESLQETFWFSEHCAFHPSLHLEGPYIVHIAAEGRATEFLEIFRAAQKKTD